MQMQHWDLKFPNLAFQCMTSFNVEAVKSVYATTIQKTVIVFILMSTCSGMATVTCPEALIEPQNICPAKEPIAI